MVFAPLATRFYYDSFSIEPKNNRVVFSYSTDAGHSFSHEITTTFPVDFDPSSVTAATFSLGMAELSHYWKATLAPEIVIKAGKLSAEQISFWENLYTKGLGEFFYINQIDFRNILHITSDASAPEIAPSASAASGKILVPLGGGKDSLVTGELLKEQKKEFSWFELEPLEFGEELRKISGVTSTVQIGRSVEKNFAPIVELVKAGAPNGHVPITATYIFSAVLAAKIFGYSDAVLSLERSAEEGNVQYLGETINHQYSKSLEFEKMAHDYVKKYIDPAITVFSLVRPLYEIQIVEKFSRFPQYFPYFVSCNRNLKHGAWCGECAKCAFMFAALMAFLPVEEVVGIFKKNLFEDVVLVPLYKELTGEGEVKPFDCVGTFEENKLALYLAGKQYKDTNLPLPPVLAQLPIEKGKQYTSILGDRGPANIPAGYSL